MSAADNEAAEAAVSCRLSIIKYLDMPVFGLSIALKVMGLADLNEASINQQRQADAIRNKILTMLVEATTMISPDKECDIINRNSQNYPGDEIVHPDIKITTGIVYFAKPIDDPWSNRGGDLPVRALSWTISKGDAPEIAILGFNPDSYVLQMIGYSDTRNMLNAKDLDLSNQPAVYPVISSAWELDVPGGGWAHRKTDSAHIKPYVNILLTYWAIIKHRLAEDVPATLRAKRISQIAHATKKRPEFNGEIRIVRIRRPPEPQEKRSSKEIPEQLYDGPPKRHKSYCYVVQESWRRSKPGDPVYYLVLGHIGGNRKGPLKYIDRVLAPPKARPEPKERES